MYINVEKIIGDFYRITAGKLSVVIPNNWLLEDVRNKSISECGGWAVFINKGLRLDVNLTTGEEVIWEQ
tara:strand:- start:30762 stop:30968 length:207 start_codon:yes stop_codon:yes gene_type:complete